jgi:ornithine carbamoyltransferase
MSEPRHFLKMGDLSEDALEAVLRRAEEFRLLRNLRQPHATRPGCVLGMVFEKASTRTRASFEVAMFDLGGHALSLDAKGSQIGRGEPIADTARVLSGYCHAIMLRTFGQDRAEEMARYARVPVINGLTDLLHPCQLLADLQAVAQRFQKSGADLGDTLRSVKYAWIGDGNNMANSWIEAAGILGLDLALCCPPGYQPDAGVVAQARGTGRGKVTFTKTPIEATAGRHVLSTDVFTSMGQEAETQQRLKVFEGYCLDGRLLAAADPTAIVLHCLPAHRGEEITADVIDGAASVVWQQAENRLHAQKALLELLLT